MRPSFSLATLASGSDGEVQSALDSRLPFRRRSSRIQVVGRRRRDPACPGQPVQHLPVVFTAVAADDRAQRGVQASMVEASTPMRAPWIRPCSTSRCSTQVNIAWCTSSGRRERVLLSQV